MFVVGTTPPHPDVNLLFTTTFLIFKHGSLIMIELAIKLGLVSSGIRLSVCTGATTIYTMGPTIKLVTTPWHETTTAIAVAVVVTITIAIVVIGAIVVAVTISVAISVAVVVTIPVALLLDGHVNIIFEPLLGCCWKY